MAQLNTFCENSKQVIPGPQGRQLDQALLRRSELVELSLSLWRRCFDHYRPELHYMRGPGPRWREKHEPSPTCASR